MTLKGFPGHRRHVPLADAFAALDVGAESLADFEARGDHAGALRASWRRKVLRYHPDKRPANWADLDEDARRKWSGQFHSVQRAYEAVEAHLLALDRRAEADAAKMQAGRGADAEAMETG